jgi:MoaA/NifB/PqqE/SkfB family radical SAM enzyme
MLRQVVRQIRNVYKHPGSGGNVTFPRLVKQSYPYYFRRDGFSLPPLTIYLSVNGRCNFRCKMCDLGQHNVESSFYKNLNPLDKAELSFDRVAQLIDEVRPYRPMIAITTTEPLIYKRLPDVIAKATSAGLETLVTTNGFNLAPLADQIVDAGLKRLYVSLDGPPALHNEVRGVEQSFERAVAGLREVDELRRQRRVSYPVMRVATVVSNHNAFALTDLLDEIVDLPIAGVTISHMNFVTREMAGEHNRLYGHIGHATETGLAAGTDALTVDSDTLWEQICAVKARFPRFAHFSPDFTKDELERFYHRPSEFVWDTKCLIPWFVAEILSNGDFIPMTRCFNVKLGNIYEGTFEDVWNGGAMRRFRQNLREHRHFPACPRCRGML